MNTLIEVEDLHEQLKNGDPNLVVMAVVPRWRHWRRRIHHSHQVWRPDLCQPGSEALIDAHGFERWARSHQLHDQSDVVLVDERYDAVRLWWAFQHYGHKRVRVLNGGLKAWQRAGLPLAHGPARRRPRWMGQMERTHSQPQDAFVARVGPAFRTATDADVWNARHLNSVQLWDTRDGDEWSGRRKLRGSRRAGRIPWARHLCWREFRQADGVTFLTGEELASVVERHGVDPSKDQVVYCQSGVRSTTMLLALAQLGWPPCRLLNHDGSWRAWSRTLSNPVLSDPRGPAGRENAS